MFSLSIHFSNSMMPYVSTKNKSVQLVASSSLKSRALHGREISCSCCLGLSRAFQVLHREKQKAKLGKWQMLKWTAVYLRVKMSLPIPCVFNKGNEIKLFL